MYSLFHLCPLFSDKWSLKYCSTMIGRHFMCLVFLVTICPVFLLHILYGLPLQSSLPCSMSVQMLPCNCSSCCAFVMNMLLPFNMLQYHTWYEVNMCVCVVKGFTHSPLINQVVEHLIECTVHNHIGVLHEWFWGLWCPSWKPAH